MRFFLGSHRPNWLGKLDVPLFISHRTLAPYRTLPVARCGWALDSGGFSELSKPPYRWVTTVGEYVEAVARYQAEIGRLEWAAPMDWMCEPFMVDNTGLSVREHQERTVSNYLELRAADGFFKEPPFIPVLQGWTLADYETCIDLYEQAGVDLAAEPTVGVGSVCRRQDTAEVGHIIREVAAREISPHGFGVKAAGIARFGGLLASADSMAWSYRARRDWPLPGCTHRSCANCSRYALRWRERLLAGQDQLAMEFANA